MTVLNLKKVWKKNLPNKLTDMKRNYKLLQDAQLKEVEQKKQEGNLPKLLLHACCAPCSSAVLEKLSQFFEITIFYYNPNIYPEAEYQRRLNELKEFLSKFKPSQNRISLIEAEYNPEDFYTAINTEKEPELAKEAERGERCQRCYLFRMQKAYEFALTNSFDYFTTTLSISPYKDAEKINVIGEMLQQPDGPSYLYADFKKGNGFLRSLQLSEEYGLYRQDYCGCVFSRENRL